MEMPMPDIAADKVIIRELVEDWAVWRDARLWDRFRTVWHADGRMMATWFQGGFEEFIKVNDEGWARGVRILHFLGGCSVDVAGDRGIAQTKMTISQRAPVDGVICDVVCTGRFFDFFDRQRMTPAEFINTSTLMFGTPEDIRKMCELREIDAKIGELRQQGVLHGAARQKAAELQIQHARVLRSVNEHHRGVGGAIADRIIGVVGPNRRRRAGERHP